jgi:hypothetical protein
MSFKDKYSNIKDWTKNNLTKENLKLHLADSAAITTVLVPVSSAIDTIIAGVSDWESIKARFLVAGVMFGGFGSVISRAGSLYRNLLNLEPKPNTDTFLPDSVNLMAGTFITCLPFYYAFGVRDLKDIFIGSAITAIASPAMLGTTNIFRTVTGLKESYSSFTKELKPRAKKGLVSLIVAASIASTAAVYNFNQDTKSLDPIKQEIQEIYSSSKKSLENYIKK